MDILCLHTREITEAWRQSLAIVGWRLQEVTHVENSPRVCSKEGRFSAVFTKLNVVRSAQYSKIVMLDSDILIRSFDIDKIFTHDASAAMRKHSSGRYVDFDQVGDEMSSSKASKSAT